MKDIFDMVEFETVEMEAIHIQVPTDLKNDFKKVCKARGVSMTSVFIKFMEVTVHNAIVENSEYVNGVLDFD